MKKYINIAVSSLFAVLMAYALVISPAFALEVSDNDATTAPSARDNGDTSSPNTQDNRDTTATPTPTKTPPPVKDNGDTSVPSTQDNGTTADRTAPDTRDNGDTSGTPATVTPDNNNNNNNGGGGGSSSGSSSRRNSNTNIISAGTDCPYISAHMRFGGENDSTEVTKLQNFLKNIEKIDVDVNGIFDQKTLDAVKAFQAKYLSDIMAPWGSDIPTGNVFMTTQKKINELVCKTPLTLNVEELSQIEAYKNSKDSIIPDVNIEKEVEVPVVEVGSEDNNQTASAFDSSILGKVWKFIKWLFGY